MTDGEIIIGLDWGAADRAVVAIAEARPDGGWTLLDLVELCREVPRRETIVTPLLTYQPRS